MSKECIHFFGPLCIHLHVALLEEQIDASGEPSKKSSAPSERGVQ